MKFKELEIKPKSNWFKRTIQSPHIRKSIIFIALGAIAGLLFFYFTEGRHMDVISSGDFLKSALIGGFFGFFITNSPCARNKC
ncbi:MAG: hypothetical protein JXJ22_03115 [Bacteroidales bacterium]|nr:hypothetical protein [Bacteroidales bacterium]